MKKLYTLLLFLFAIFQVQAQCNLSLSSISPVNYVTGGKGAMFDITTGTNPITVTGFDMHLGYGGNPYEIYYKQGSHIGFENTPAVWINAGTAMSVNGSVFSLTPVPIPLSITIPANTTYSFYITSTSSGYIGIGGNSGSTTMFNSDITVGNPIIIGYPFGVTVESNLNILAKINYAMTGSFQPTIATTGTLAELYTNVVSQNASLPYTATTGAPVSYSINWDAAANTAGLTDQMTTNFTFTSGVGNLNNISVPANLPAGTYTGNLIIRNAGNCTNANIQPIRLKINPPFTCPADITVSNDVGVCGAVVNYTFPVATSTKSKLKILLLANDFNNKYFDVQQKLINTGDFGTVDFINIGSTTPTLTKLQEYEAILIYINENINNPVQLGNILAQYIDSGGGVVDDGGILDDFYHNIAGTYNTPDYRVLISPSYNLGAPLTLGTIDLPTHPIMSGITSFDGGLNSLHGNPTTLTPGSYVVAKYNNNRNFVVAKENVGLQNVRRASLNFYFPSSSVQSGAWNMTTDGTKLIRNALIWVGNSSKATQIAGFASGAAFPVGTTTNTFEYTDINGYIQTCSFDVTVKDNEAPVADLATLSTITAQCELASITAPTATDNCIGTVTGITTTTFPITASTTVVWTYSDGINTSTQNQAVTIADTMAPVADLATLSTITAQCEVASITAPTATDNCIGTVTGITTTTFPITASTTVVWTYSDGINTSTQNQTVTIADTMAPIADLATLFTITAQCEVASITAPTATDNCIGAVTSTTTTTFPITASTTVVWTYSDGINTLTQNQTVTIADTMAPVADLATLFTIRAQCEVASITPPTATDNCIGAVTGTTTTTFPIKASTTIVWTYSDGINTSTQNQTVTIADTMAPVADLATLFTIRAQCEIASITAPTATDNCIGAVTGITTTTFPITASTTVVWTYSDGINTSTQNQIVTIADAMAPVADLATLPIINGQCEVPAIIAPTATDNCLGAVTGTTTTTFPITASTTIVWTYSDGINTSTQNQTVIIVDTTKPLVITKSIKIQLNSLGNAAITTMDINNGSTDNCGIASMVLDKNIFNCSNVGVNAVSLTVTDTSGNSASQTASVIVEIVPIINVSNLLQKFCAIDQPLVSDISIPYNVLNWFADPLSTPALLSQEVLRSGIYYAEVSINACNTSRIPVTIMVNDEAAPSGNAIQYFCREKETVISDLITNEKEILWYDTASGGIPLDSDTLLEDKHKYYASYFGAECESTKRFEVQVIFNYCDVIVKNGISANGDGKNDYLAIEGVLTFADNQLEIFNTSGSLVYSVTHYGQGDNLFRGFANKGLGHGKGLLPFGTYYYIFSFTNNENKRVTKKGFLHLNP